MNGDAFGARRYFFATGVHAGETAAVRDEDGTTLFTYRGFAHVVGVIAALVAAIVGLAGLAATALLLAERAPLRAAGALTLTAIFTFLIVRLVPRTSVTLHHGTRPVLSVVQTSHFPTARYSVAAEGQVLGELAHPLLSRIGRNRWLILQGDRLVAEASEESFRSAMGRKFFGKFSRRWQADIVVESGGIPAARIHRRDGDGSRSDYLDLTGDTLEPRLAVALATIVFGSET